MTDLIAKKVAKNLLKEHAGKPQNVSDPYFEYVAATDMNGRATGKTIKRKRQAPPGLTKQEEKVLKKVTRQAYRLDNAFNLCGIRVGWGAVFGILPVIGDFADTILALMVLRTIYTAKIPKKLQSQMMFNIVIDFFIGLVPLLGDFADALWRANTKNAALLYQHLEKRGADRLARGEVPDGKPSSRRHSPAGGRGVVIQQPEMREQMHSSHGTRSGNVQQPQAARTKTGGLLDRYNPLSAPKTDRRDLENGEGGHRSHGHGHGQAAGRTGRRLL